MNGKTKSADLVSILRQRSLDIAARTTEETAPETFIEVVVVDRRGVHLGFPISTVEEVRTVKITALPHSTAVVAGLFQVRGQTSCLIDIASFFGDTDSINHGDRTRVILTAGTPGVVGIRIDEVVGPRTISNDEIQNEVQGAIDFVSNITHDLVHIIDVNRMLSLPAMRIRGS